MIVTPSFKKIDIQSYEINYSTLLSVDGMYHVEIFTFFCNFNDQDIKNSKFHTDAKFPTYTTSFKYLVSGKTIIQHTIFVSSTHDSTILYQL